MHGSIFKSLEVISTNFVLDAHSNFSVTDFDIGKNLIPLNEMYLGPTCKEIIKDLPSDVLKAILKSCQNFYITSLRNMKKRFLEHDDLFKKLFFVDPKIALSKDSCQMYLDLADVSTFFPFIDKYSLAWE